MKVTLNYKNALSFVSEEALNQNKENVLKAYKTLVNKTGEGNDFLGWIEYPKNYDIKRIDIFIELENIKLQLNHHNLLKFCYFYNFFLIFY